MIYLELDQDNERHATLIRGVKKRTISEGNQTILDC